MSYKSLFMCMLSLFAGFAVMSAHAANGGMTLLKQHCASCHNLTGPAPHTFIALAARKGPDLFYAGDKYRRNWLQTWLQHPDYIRPSGMAYRAYINTKGNMKSNAKGQGNGDHTSARQTHLALNAADAAIATDALMQLQSNTLRINTVLQQPAARITEILPRGSMLFKHVYGCQMCHQIAPGVGGTSAPELYSAGRRMSAAFMRSYIRSPQLWNPKIWMPNLHAPEANIEKLVNYIVALPVRKQGTHDH